HAAPDRAAAPAAPAAAPRRVLRAGAVQPHPVDPAPGARRTGLFHAGPAAPLPRVLAARTVLLVLRRHRHGEPRPPRRLHLCAWRGCADGEPVHRLDPAVAGTRTHAASANRIPGGTAQPPA